jgi:hypothetical protein
MQVSNASLTPRVLHEPIIKKCMKTSVSVANYMVVTFLSTLICLQKCDYKKWLS